MSSHEKPPYWVPSKFADSLIDVRDAAEMIAERIRAELVCCSPEDIDAIQHWVGVDPNTGDDTDPGGRSKRRLTDAPGYHAICYWGEMAARLAEDPHALLLSPYECDGQHPGPCWNTRPGEEEDDGE